MGAGMKVGTFSKQPGEIIINSVNYDDSLDEGDTVDTVVSCTVAPAGLTISAMLASNKRVRILSSGGTDGVSYKITLIVDTANGERFEDELICKVKEI
jgi:hypothetical protein